MTEIVPMERITGTIYLIRGIKFMLDRDLAELYQIETSQLKRAVRRHIDRFPKDFMFELTKDELENWRCQIGISNSIKMGLRYRPMAFTDLRGSQAVWLKIYSQSHLTGQYSYVRARCVDK